MKVLLSLIWGCVAILIGLYVHRNHWYALSDLPVIKRVTESYESGLIGISEISQYALKKFYEGELIESITTTNVFRKEPETSGDKIRIHPTWKKEEVLSKLKKSGFRGKKLENAKRYIGYIDKYKGIALRDMYFKKIPASIKLAQGLLESGAGNSRLATKTNNHFGIKARPTKSGRKKIKAKKIHLLTDADFTTHSMAIGVYNFEDDNKYDRFEIHKSVEDSYNRHTRLLSRPCGSGKGCYAWIWDTYKVGKKTYRVDEQFYGNQKVNYYAACAAGLKKSGYATDKNYHHKLVSLIGTYELWRFDVDLVNTLEEL